MIICYQGSPGSGKSYDAVNRIIENLRRGRVVYTNIDGLDDDRNREVIKNLAKLNDYELSQNLIYLANHQAQEFWKHIKNNSFILLDEIHKLFNARDWQKASNRQFTDWASTHRHNGNDLIMITQDINKVDSQVRSLVEFTYHYRKNNMFGSLLGVQKTFTVYAYMDGEAKGKPLGKKIQKYNQAIFQAYKSYDSNTVKEQGFQTHVNILKHPVFYAIPLVLLIFGYFFTKSSFAKGSLFGTSDKAKSSVSQVKPVSQVKYGKPVIVEGPVYFKNPETVKNKKMNINLKRIVPLGSSVPVVSSLQIPVLPLVKVDLVHRILGIFALGDDVQVKINGSLMSLTDLNLKYQKSFVFRDGLLCEDARCYNVGDSFS